MPHVLVAGATGSGKSVCLNAIITGLLFQHGPETLRMVMIDPKMLELSAYNGIPHLVMPVITEAKKASRALRWAVSEMEKRYKLMATCGARNIAGYNDKVAAGQVPAPADDGAPPPERLSYVVVVIDELADLMLTAPAEIEEPIARLAQMARAVGIHLVLATQRPSVDVITGVIKANFPSRIAFQVASKTDSRTVLDMNGAENLLGHGDMLFTPAGKPEPYRIHGCYVSEEETARVVDFWKAKLRAVPLGRGCGRRPRRRWPRVPICPRPTRSRAPRRAATTTRCSHDAARLVVSHQQGSTSLLQRRLKVGYSRAGRLMDQLEQIGVVGSVPGQQGARRAGRRALARGSVRSVTARSHASTSRRPRRRHVARSAPPAAGARVRHARLPQEHRGLRAHARTAGARRVPHRRRPRRGRRRGGQHLCLPAAARCVSPRTTIARVASSSRPAGCAG